MTNDPHREEFESFLPKSRKDRLEEESKKRKQKFAQGCLEGYKLLEEFGGECIQGIGRKKAVETLNRMIGYFIQNEEYEKCSVIKKIHFKTFGSYPSPIFINFEAELEETEDHE